jgi:hypothetical protein
MSSVAVIGADTATSGGTQLTAPGATNTKGAYLEISSSTPAAANALLVEVIGFAAAGDILLDIATGAASSEVDLVSNIHFHADSATATKSTFFYLPVSIAAGTRVACRYQATSTSVAIWIVIHLLNETNNVPLTACVPTTYGANTADSGATSVDPGGTANTKGAYAELEDSTADAIDWITIHVGNRNNTAMTTASWLIDIATGAAASETVVVPNVYNHAPTNGDIMDSMFIGPFPVTIAAGTRLSARAQCSINDATDRLIDVEVIGWNGTPASGGSSAHFSASFSG